jgi:hypothetical protein
VIIIARNVGIKTIQAKALKKMCLPQIANVIINATRFIPVQHGSNIADQ